MLQLRRPTSGRVLFDGHDLTTMQGDALRLMRRRVQLIFQDPIASLNPRRKIGDIVAEPLVIAGVKDPEERKKKVDFTQKYQDTPAKLIAKKGSGIDPEKKETMKGKTIGVQVSTIHEKFAKKMWGDVATIKSYDTQDNANLDLANGRLDMVMADSTALDFGFLKTDLGKDFEFVGPGYDDPEIHGEGAGIAIRKGEDELRNALNNAIQEIRKDGTYQKIQSKYFDYDVYGSET